MMNQIKKIRLQGTCFRTETVLELFDSGNDKCRLSVVFGRNGSGKTTIAEAFRKIKGEVVQRVSCAELLDKNDQIVSPENTENIYVFDENYIRQNIVIEEDGLDSIVILGKQLQIDNEIKDIETQRQEYEHKIDELDRELSKYEDDKSIFCPQYYTNRIKEILSSDDNWADREKRIKNNSTKSPVRDDIICRIIESQPSHLQSFYIDNYKEGIRKLEFARGNKRLIQDTVECITVDVDENRVKNILGEILEKPELSEREKMLFQLVDEGKRDRLVEIRNVFSKDKTTVCPFCFQDVTNEYKISLCEIIENVLNEKVEKHIAQLKELLLETYEIDLSPFVELDELLSNDTIAKCYELNEEIRKHNEAINKKIQNPFEPVYYNCNIVLIAESLNKKLVELENRKIEHNRIVESNSQIIKDLQELNLKIAYYDINRLYMDQKRLIDDCNQLLEDRIKVNEAIESYNSRITGLLSEKRNIKIAIELINEKLSYVFFSDKRIKLLPSDDGRYKLLVNECAVMPNSISSGERNALALCYFFTDILRNCDESEKYTKESFVIIDDPISSMDRDVRIGILSLLNNMLECILIGNKDSKVLIFSHDLSVTYDLERTSKQVANSIKRKTGSLKNETRELLDDRIQPINIEKKKEYKFLLQNVYDYSLRESDAADDISIGNMMRRVIEAFGTFVYSKGLSDILIDDDIMSSINNDKLRNNLRKTMFTLVLNEDSHMEKETQRLDDMSYMETISTDEKRRIARSMLCLMYSLNKHHIIAYLKNDTNIENNIEQWIQEISA